MHKKDIIFLGRVLSAITAFLAIVTTGFYLGGYSYGSGINVPVIPAWLIAGTVFGLTKFIEWYHSSQD